MDNPHRDGGNGYRINLPAARKRTLAASSRPVAHRGSGGGLFRPDRQTSGIYLLPPSEAVLHPIPPLVNAGWSVHKAPRDCMH